MKRTLLLLAVFCLLLAGCGREENGYDEADGRPDTEQEALLAGELSPGRTLSIKAVQAMHFADPEEGYVGGSTYYRFVGSRIYMLRAEFGEKDDAPRLCVQVYDTEDNGTEQYVFTPQAQGHEGCRIFSADLTADQEISLKMKDAGEENNFFLIKTDLQGNVLEVEEPFPEGLYPWNLDPWEDVKSFALSDGRSVLSRFDNGEQRTTLTWIDEEEGGESPLGAVQDDFINSLMMDEEGILYYLGGNSLVRWDVEKNSREELFELYENGVEPGAEASGLIKNTQGEILLCRLRQGKGTIYVLTDQELPDRERIRLSSLWGAAGIDYFRRQAATFTQNGGEIPISLELESRHMRRITGTGLWRNWWRERDRISCL